MAQRIVASAAGREHAKDSLDIQAPPGPAAEEVYMDVVYRRCCGLDVHKHSVVACLLLLDEAGRKQQKKREFAFSDDLRRLMCGFTRIR